MATESDIVLAAIAGGLGGPIAVWSVKTALERLLAKGDKAEQQRGDWLQQAISGLTSSVGTIERHLDVALEKLQGQAAGLGEARARIDGISANHGGRIAQLEAQVVELRTRFDERAKRP